jgi:hypothetical protein
MVIRETTRRDKMKKAFFYSIFLLFLINNPVFAFDSGSTGADGAFNPTSDTEVQLPPDGKINYTTVTIPTGVTVTFKKNSANTPVYILATGDVTIDGTISVNGSDASGIYPGKGGPGGFDGGLGGTVGVDGGKGLGPGAGGAGTVTTQTGDGSGSGGGGGYGSPGEDGSTSNYSTGGSGGSTYGNSRIMPMIGGSGGGGGAGYLSSNSGGAGGGGGGAILIASSTTITVNGSITANGGAGAMVCEPGKYAGCGGGGSGGAIKLMADTITGDGTITANGGAGGKNVDGNGGGDGGDGRIRLEANTVTGTLSSPSSTTPIYTYSHPGTVFPTNEPTLTITSVGGVAVPANPSGSYGSPDVTLPSTTTNPVTVEVSATNIPVGTMVTVESVPEYGGSSTASGALSGTDSSSTASVSINLSTQYQNILTATATFTIQTAMYYDNEKIEKVRVATTIGKGSEVVYITEKGREIPSTELVAKMMKQ